MITEMEYANAGEFLREYGKQYFIVVKEALDIDRVKFSLLPIGKNGKEELCFYLTTTQMFGLCQQIERGVFAKKISVDTAAYPSAYKYITGNSGHLHLNIGGGKVGCRVQIQDSTKKLNYTMAVSMEAIDNMARRFLMFSGFAAVSNNTYCSELISSFQSGRKNRAKFLSKREQVEDSITVEEAIENKDEEVCNEQFSTDTQFKLIINGEKTLKNGYYSFPGKDENGDNIILLFKKDEAKSIKWFDGFVKAAETGTTISIVGEKKGTFILYKGTALKN